MGDDFIAKHKDHYNRSLTKNLHGHFDQPALFRPLAKETISYPCRLNDACDFPSTGQKLTLRLVGDLVELLDKQRVIGFVSPEANQDVVDDFKANPGCLGILAVDVISIFEDAKRIDVTPDSDMNDGGD
jgi:hypothetical protein